MEDQTQPNPTKEKRPQKTSLLAILILIAVLLGAIIIAGYFYFVPADRENKNTNQVAVSSNSNENQNTSQLLGGDEDEHGCKGSAGYSWCEAKQKCLRIWEEVCPSSFNNLGNSAPTLSGEFWMIQNYTAKLKSINIANKEIKEWTEYPNQPQNSENEIPAPKGNHMLYNKKDTDGNWALYVSETNGKNEKLITTGGVCTDGPCSKENTYGVGKISPDGQYVSFRKGENSIVKNLVTDKETILPLKLTLAPAAFTPLQTYVYTVSQKENEVNYYLEIGKLSDTEFRLINPALSLFYAIDFSPDENYFAISGNQGVCIYETKTGQLLDKKESNDMSGIYEIVWLSNNKLILRTHNSVLHQFTLIDHKITEEIIYKAEYLDSLFRIDDNNVLLRSGGNDLIVINTTTGTITEVYSSDDYFAILGSKE